MSPTPDEDLEIPDGEGEPEADASEVDAGEDDGESGEDAGQDPEAGEEEGPDEVEGEPQRRKPSRSERRIQAVRAEAREAKAHAQRLETEMARLRTERQTVQQPRMSPEEEAIQERERLAIMTPEERMEYRLEKAERTNAARMQQMSFQHQESLDIANYNAKAIADPRYRKYEPEVNAEIAKLRSNGQNASREAVLKYIIGEKVLARAAGAPNKQVAAAKGRVAGQKARPMNGRADVQATRGKDLSLAKRLENVPI